MFHSNFGVGEHLLERGWTTEQTIDDLIKSLPPEQLVKCLLVTMVTRLNDAVEAIEALPVKIAKASIREEILLEKEKQKTAKAQRAVIDATPPTVIQTRTEGRGEPGRVQSEAEVEMTPNDTRNPVRG